MAEWLQNPLFVVAFIGTITLFFRLQISSFCPVGTSLLVRFWIVAGMSVVGTGIAQRYAFRNLALALFFLFIASGAVGTLLKIVDLVRFLR